MKYRYCWAVALAFGLCTSGTQADIDMTGWTPTAEQTGMEWSPTGGGYNNDGYGDNSDTGHWGQASGGSNYSVNQLAVWTRGTEIRVVVVSGLRWKGRGGFILGDVGIDTDGDGLYNAALLKPDISHDQSQVDFTMAEGDGPILLANGLVSDDWVDVHYGQFPNNPFAVDDGRMDSSNAWEETTVTFDYDYRASGTPDSDFYTPTAGDKVDIVDRADFIYAWTFDTVNLASGFGWTDMHVAVQCGNDGIDLTNRPIPAPGAALLGMIGLTLVGKVRRRFA